MPSSSLLSNVTSEAQYQANLLTNTPALVKVLVEDEEDIVVWYRFLKICAPQLDFEISPYSYDPTLNGKGKANVLRMAANYGSKFLGCVDSDFDWLLEDWTPDGSIIKNSPYILQTYAYSIENLAAQPGGQSDWMLEYVLHSCKLQRDLDKDYASFIHSISVNVYELLIWHLLMKKEGMDEGAIGVGWESVFGNDHYADILSDHTLTVESKRIAVKERFKDRADKRIDHYDELYGDLKEQWNDLREYMSVRYGVTPENAYLFVRGHNLHDFLMHCFFDPLRNALAEDHKNEILAHNHGADRKNPINHYTNHLRIYKRDYLHKTAYIEDSTDTLTKAILSDINKALSH